MINEEIPVKTNIPFMREGAIPIDKNGTLRLPKLPTRELVGDFMTARHLSDDLLMEHFHGMIQQMFNGIVNQDEEVLNKLAEPNLAKRLIAGSQKAKGLKYTAPGDDAIDKAYLIDKLFIKGVSVKREENDSNADYIALKDQEARGIRTYVHKFHLGLQPYYYKKVYEHEIMLLTDEECQKDPEAYYRRGTMLRHNIHSQKKKMTDNAFQMVFRITMQFTDKSIG